MFLVFLDVRCTDSTLKKHSSLCKTISFYFVTGNNMSPKKTLLHERIKTSATTFHQDGQGVNLGFNGRKNDLTKLHSFSTALRAGEMFLMNIALAL